MSEIKFRQWLGKRFRYWGFVDGSANAFISPTDKEGSSDQFTGIKHQDREVYEKDVYYIAGTGNCYVKICPMYGVVFRCSQGTEIPYIDELAENNIGEHLGNLYESPELLEDK